MSHLYIIYDKVSIWNIESTNNKYQHFIFRNLCSCRYDCSAKNAVPMRIPAYKYIIRYNSPCSLRDSLRELCKLDNRVVEIYTFFPFVSRFFSIGLFFHLWHNTRQPAISLANTVINLMENKNKYITKNIIEWDYYTV